MLLIFQYSMLIFALRVLAIDKAMIALLT